MCRRMFYAEMAIVDGFNALGGAALSRPDIFGDGCHPTEQGYFDLALEVARVLEALTEPHAAKSGLFNTWGP